MDEVDQEDRAQEDCFGRGFPVAGKGDTEVVGVAEGLLGQPAPFLGDSSLFHLILHDLERPRFQQRAKQLKDFFAGWVGNRIDPACQCEPFDEFSEKLPVGIHDVCFVKIEAEGATNLDDRPALRIDDQTFSTVARVQTPQMRM